MWQLCPKIFWAGSSCFRTAGCFWSGSSLGETQLGSAQQAASGSSQRRRGFSEAGRTAWDTPESKLSPPPQSPRATPWNGYGVARPEGRVDLEISEVPVILLHLAASGSRVARPEDRVDLAVSEISVASATRYRQTLWRSHLLLSGSYPRWDWRKAHGWRKLPWALSV